jgi:surface protein
MSSWYVISDAATVTVLPRIYTHPKNVTVPYGSSDDVYFSCSAGGVGLQYQWQYDSGSGWQNSNAEGAQTQQIRMTANRSRDGYQYRCVITDQNGKQLTTSAALLRFETGNAVLSADGVLTLIGEPTRAQILAYRTDQNVTAVVAAKGMVLPANCAELFWNGQSVRVDYYDEEYYNDYSDYKDHYYWKNVKTVDLSQADASKVTTMRKMFGCFDGRKLEYYYPDPYDDWDYSVRLIRFGYSPYTSINLSGLDTSRVKDMSAMFHGCTALTELNLSGISTSAVTTMRKMFCKCTALTALDLRSLDTAKVTEMTSMFSGMSAVEAITVSDKWSTAAVTEGNDADMFCDCKKLTGGNGTAFDSTKTDSSYARIDKPGQPGYLSGNAQIITQPQNASAAAGKTVTLTVAASGAGLSYQWQYNSGSGWKNSGASGNKTASLTLYGKTTYNGWQFRCVITDANGKTTTSGTAVFRVRTAITAQPADVEAASGTAAKFTVKATGIGLSYQWQYNSGSGWKNSNAAGATTGTLTVSAKTSYNGWQYRCIITDANGAKTNSDAAALTVK